MAVVKADGYGHGLLPAARAVLAGGADALGVAVLDEALALRAGRHHRAGAGLAARPGHRLRRRARPPTSRSRSTPSWGLDEVVAAARADRPHRPAAPKVDTGLSREGATPGGLARRWSRRPPARRPTATSRSSGCGATWPTPTPRPTRRSAAQVRVFEEAVAIAAGRRPHRRAPAPGQLGGHGRAAGHLVRHGPAGHRPLRARPARRTDPRAHGLRPAMTVRAAVALTKRVPAGVGVSYGHTYFPERETTLALVPVGYADGVPRAAGNRAPVLAAGAQRTIAGRVCMDQFVLDVGDDAGASPGTRSSCGARATAASRPRSSGPTRSTPSTTSWSPGSAGGSPAATSARPGRSDGAPRSRRPSTPRHAGHRRGRRRPGRRRHRGRRGGQPRRGPPGAARPSSVRRARDRAAPSTPTPTCGRTTRSGRASRPADRTALVQTDDGVLLAVEEIGPRDAPLTVVFVHGYTLSMASWTLPAADAGRRAGHRQRPPPRRPAGLLRPARARRLRPRGRPSARRSSSSRRDLAAVLEARVPRGPVVLVGHSMGGMTIMGAGRAAARAVRHRGSSASR